MSGEQGEDAFQHLLNEEHNLLNHQTTLKIDLQEHETMVETLNSVDPGRKCFRMVGDVLAEETVKEVLPKVVAKKEFIEQTIAKITEELTTKEQQIKKFKEEHNIKIMEANISNSFPEKEDDA